jgi:hypothetical protein
MKNLLINDAKKYVESTIDEFHKPRIEKLKSLNLHQILKRKNPYLFRAKYVLKSHDFVKSVLDAHISSNEETLFGGWLEKFAIFICGEVYNGRKSTTKGIDLEFDSENIRYIVSIKSGPNWGNSGQIADMKKNFQTAIKTLRTNHKKLNVIAVNGCCYGKDSKPCKEGYYKYCGQDFWEFISGNSLLYTEIIEPLGYKAKEKNERYLEAYANVLNNLTFQFTRDFCHSDGSINWEKVVIFNSGKNLEKV